MLESKPLGKTWSLFDLEDTVYAATYTNTVNTVSRYISSAMVARNKQKRESWVRRRCTWTYCVTGEPKDSFQSLFTQRYTGWINSIHQQTKGKVYDRILEYIELEGYPTELSRIYRKSRGMSGLVVIDIGFLWGRRSSWSRNGLLLLFTGIAVSPMLECFINTTGRENIQLQANNTTSSINGEVVLWTSLEWTRKTLSL